MTDLERTFEAAKSVTATHGGARRNQYTRKEKGLFCKDSFLARPVTVQDASERYSVSKRSIDKMKRAIRILGEDKVWEFVQKKRSMASIERYAVEEQKQIVFREPQSNEKHFMLRVMNEGRRLGWRVTHTRVGNGSDNGFPDVTMVKGGRLIFAELKFGKGKTMSVQDDWLSDLVMVSGAECYLWYPEDWDQIVKVLVRSR